MPAASCDFSFSFHLRQRERFHEGSLAHEWRDRYPQLFDADDQRMLTTQHQRRYHFFEWLSAILLFESTGYLSMVEKYTSQSHRSKRQRLEALLPSALFEWLSANESGQPDLFVYDSTTLDWYFCEVKGGQDRIRANQADWMARLVAVLIAQGISHRNRTRVLCLQQIDA
ncbi:VRR-NUC domain-containing protein [Polaromonas sp. P1(28)-8]|nr:VRR-NUC domain-containing protein [Polaromonas sp. P1(28)-8]